nr:uncharacterized protein CTRU02_05993 [Colletotrichum truncatum]KAF6793121.1 hypothetical protein CTRU02_05993 [Colletotrichum truncatum]
MITFMSATIINPQLIFPATGENGLDETLFE